MKKGLLICYLCLFAGIANAQELNLENGTADLLEFIGVAVEDTGYHIWGSAPIYGKDDKVHIFAARWPDTINFDPGWRTHSEIAHYIADDPEGPFEFSDLVLTPTGRHSWDKMGIHNPNIQQVKDQYVLTFISNDGIETHPANQRIGMAISASLYGPWKKVGKDGMILAPLQTLIIGISIPVMVSITLVYCLIPTEATSYTLNPIERALLAWVWR